MFTRLQRAPHLVQTREMSSIERPTARELVSQIEALDLKNKKSKIWNSFIKHIFVSEKKKFKQIFTVAFAGSIIRPKLFYLSVYLFNI